MCRNQRSPERKYLLGKPGVLLRIDYINTRAKHRDGLAFGDDGTAVPSRIHPSSHAADDGQAACGEIACQPFGHSSSVRRRVPGSNDCDAGL